MKKIEEVTCIKFEERSKNNHQEPISEIVLLENFICEDILVLLNKETSYKDYIEFQNGNSCYSFAGRDGQKQAIVLFELCAEEHTLIHEVYFVIERGIF